MIILEKTKEEEILLNNIADIIAPSKVAQVSSRINFAGRYNWVISNIYLDIAKKLRLTGIKNY